MHGSPGSLTSAVDGPSVVGAVRSSEQAGPSQSFVGVPEPLVVAHEKGAVERGAGVDITSSAVYSEQVALERIAVRRFVMVCACSLRTQQCAEMLVPCFFVLFFVVLVFG